MEQRRRARPGSLSEGCRGDRADVGDVKERNEAQPGQIGQERGDVRLGKEGIKKARSGKEREKQQQHSDW